MSDFIFPALSTIRLLDVIDVFLVAILLYELYNLVKGTAAIKILIGIVAVFIMWRIVKALEIDKCQGYSDPSPCCCELF